jgi:hypothetical protein
VTDPIDVARGLLDAETTGRGALKRRAEVLDRAPEVRVALLALAASRGIEIPSGAESWPGKRLLRHVLGREEEARRRTNPIARDEGFTCAHCGAEVAPHGRTARDHCPRCLWSLHVDVVPGDRAASCGGKMRPVAVERDGSAWTLVVRCERCALEHRNAVLRDGDSPDDWERVVALAARAGG